MKKEKILLGLFLIDCLVNLVLRLPFGVVDILLHAMLYLLLLGSLGLGNFGDHAFKTIKNNPHLEVQLLLFLGGILIGASLPLILFGYYWRLATATTNEVTWRIVSLILAILVSLVCLAQLVRQIVKALSKLPKSF